MSNMVVQTNVLALNSHRNLKTVGTAQTKASQRLSSGYKINSAADDAAGLAISEKMRAQIRGLDMASKNAQDAISLIQTAEGGMQEIDNMLQRVRELVNQAANDTNENNTENTGDRQKMQDEIDQLTQEIDSMAERVEFNKKKIINGSYSGNSTKTTANKSENYDATYESYTAASAALVAAGTAVTAASGAATLAAAVCGSFTATPLYGSYSASDAGVVASASGAYTDALSAVTGTAALAELAKDLGLNTTGVTGTQDATVYTYSMSASGDTVNFTGTVVGSSELGEMTANGNYTLVELTEAATVVTVNGTVTVSLLAESWGSNIGSDAAYSVATDVLADPDSDDAKKTTAQAYINNYDTLNALETAYNTQKGIYDEVQTEVTTLAQNVTVANNTVTEKQSAYDEANAKFQLAKLKFETEAAKTTSTTETTKGSSLYFQVGANANQGINVTINAIKTDKLGIGDGNGKSSINVLEDTGSDITAYLDTLDTALSYVTSERSKLGATQNRLEYTINSLDVSSENLSAAESRIRDTDMAKEMMAFTKANVLQQAATSMLAQANQAPQNVLQLLG